MATSWLVKDKKSSYDESVDIIKEVERKVAMGELGRSPIEMLANAKSLIEQGANSVDAALMRFVTADQKMIEAKSRVKMLYKRAEPVLITGPTGVGKELIARALKIPGEPFVAENCAGIPETLVESIFFGHKKGAFTGASENKIGLLKEAGEGIIFLDEIGDMPLAIQAKMLRAIQENEIRPVGDVKAVDIECRFVAATKYDLEERVNKGLFREDLYARLFTYQIHITGLKDRIPDIELITRSMLAVPEKYGTEEMPSFPSWLLEKIFKYNVRAIEAAIARHRAYGSYE